MTQTLENQERDAVMRERAAFVAGSEWRFGKAVDLGDRITVLAPDVAKEIRPISSEAARRYPLPKVKRPRVVRDPHRETHSQNWRCVDGVIEFNAGDGCTFKPAFERGRNQRIEPEYCTWPTPLRIAMWSDLLANPTEEVEAE